MEYILPAIRELPSRQKEAATYPYNPKVRNRLERSSERSDKAGPISSLRKIRQRVPDNKNVCKKWNTVHCIPPYQKEPVKQPEGTPGIMFLTVRAENIVEILLPP